MSILISSHTSRTSQISEGINPGNRIPKIILEDSGKDVLNLSDFAGKKILLNFWAAYDANSHMETVLLSNAVKKESYPIQIVSISFDKSRSVFEKTLALDEMDTSFQFYDMGGKDSEIYKKFKLEKGFKNILIDENGTIQAVNLSSSELRRMFDKI